MMLTQLSFRALLGLAMTTVSLAVCADDASEQLEETIVMGAVKTPEAASYFSAETEQEELAELPAIADDE